MTAPEGLYSAPRGMKFRSLAQSLRDRIGEEWRVGGGGPTERERCPGHQGGLHSVRRAVDLLVEEGLLRRRQGSGTFVIAAPARDKPGQRVIGVLVPSTSYFYPKVIEGIQRVASAAGAQVMLSCSEY